MRTIRGKKLNFNEKLEEIRQIVRQSLTRVYRRNGLEI